MRWFFYGTLTDREVLAIVLGRPVDPTALAEAAIAGYRRVAVRDAVYPALTPAPGATVAGVVAMLDAPDDEARLRWFEGDDYELVDALVATADGDVPTRVFVAGAGMALRSDVDWTPGDWSASAGRDAIIDEARAAMAAFSVAYSRSQYAWSRGLIA